MVEAHRALPLAKIWGDGTTSSSDLPRAVSVGAGHASASGMLHRLAAHPRQKRVAVALREIGRVERSLFTLNWLRSGELRQRPTPG